MEQQSLMPEHAKTKKKRGGKKFNIRLAVQIFFFVLVGAIATNHSLEEQGKAIPVLSSASLHAICPFGGVETLYQYLTSGTLVRKLSQSVLVLMWIGLALALLTGPSFCGWVCPLGSFQEWLSNLGRKILTKKFNQFLSPGVDKYLRYLRYGVLIWVVWLTASSAKLVFADYDPYFALFNFWRIEEIAFSALVIFGVVILLSLVMERPFCKYACPYGAVLGLFNLFRVFQIKRSEKTCFDCKTCDRVCPMNIHISTSSIIRDHQCISCLKCTSEESCPVTNTVAMAFGKM